MNRRQLFKGVLAIAVASVLPVAAHSTRLTRMIKDERGGWHPCRVYLIQQYDVERGYALIPTQAKIHRLDLAPYVTVGHNIRVPYIAPLRLAA